MSVTDARTRLAQLIVSTILAILLYLSAHADSVNHSYPSDERLRSFDETLQSNVHECLARSNDLNRCTTVEQQRLQRTFPMRGTRQYVQTYYLQMKTDELLDLRGELIDQETRARSQREFWIDNPRPAGELTKEMLGNELTLIDQELQKRNRQSVNGIRSLQRDLKHILN